MSSLKLATGKGEQRQGFPLAALRGYAETWAHDKKGEEEGSRADEGASGVAEMVTDCIAKSRGVQVAGSYALLHGSDAALFATIQVCTSLSEIGKEFVVIWASGTCKMKLEHKTCFAT